MHLSGRVGKSTIAEHFAATEYRSYILIDFGAASPEILSCFEDIYRPELFFLRLQAITGISLYEHESVLIFDEVQLFPKARQAIKQLVKYGKYHYIEMGSLISIKKNVKNILIPSEKMRIPVYPMDYEEFCEATGGNYALLATLFDMTDPRVSLSLTKDLDCFKLYIADIGLFVTLLFIDRPITENELYAKLLSDKLPANLGYLYENLVAQMLTAAGRELYYHTWEKEGSSHYYEIDFLISQGSKVSAIEVKSSGTGKHESLVAFGRKYAKNIRDCVIVSQKDVDRKEGLTYLSVYLFPFLVND
ncbi:MAG: ATP-binding protein [Lachnospiraceae bacterium]|nr:ATP-binding protein [Lachnospiraceae bacterium]